VSLLDISKATEGASGADLNAIVVEAGMNALRRRASFVAMDDFEKAIKKVLGDEDQSTEEALRMFS
jgi:proteasome regulatory subunit